VLRWRQRGVSDNYEHEHHHVVNDNDNDDRRESDSHDDDDRRPGPLGRVRSVASDHR
jgi:hypothetical protein